jgi:hypothetical protein
MPVFVLASDRTLASPIRMRVTPLTIGEALARGVITEYSSTVNEELSPTRAGNVHVWLL